MDGQIGQYTGTPIYESSRLGRWDVAFGVDPFSRGGGQVAFVGSLQLFRARMEIAAEVKEIVRNVMRSPRCRHDKRAAHGEVGKDWCAGGMSPMGEPWRRELEWQMNLDVSMFTRFLSPTE